MIIVLAIAYGAVAGIIVLAINDYKGNNTSYYQKIMSVKDPAYNGIIFRSL